MDMNLRKYWEILEDRRVWQAVVHGVAKRKDFTTEQNQQQQVIYPINQVTSIVYLLKI